MATTMDRSACMKGARPLALLVLLALLGRAEGQIPVIRLQLEAALPVEGLEGAEPGGLTLVDGELYAVSDAHDHAICRVQLRDDRAILEPFITFDAPWSGAWTRNLDFEGLAYFQSSFYLVSEATYRVLRVHEGGGDLEWVTPSVEAAGREAGLFGVKGAGLEGIAVLGPGRFLLAAEREPRGLIDVGEGDRVTAYALEGSAIEVPAPRPPDIADLFLDPAGLFALVRNADAVVRIDFGEDGFRELEAWSFSEVANDPAYRYADVVFGKAEGLCMDADRVYVILDNNGHGRQADALDTRPLLFIFARP